MGALQKLLNNIREKWKNTSSGKKVGIIVLASGIVTALIFFGVTLSKPKYEPLFYNMETADMAQVVSQLKTDKVSYQIQGNTILVPKDQVEELRLTVASSGTLPSEGKGFELFDQSKFGVTDTETKIMYQRALETELQRTIKAYDEVEYARVHLVMPEESVFVKNEEPASASVTLKLKNNTKLSKEQVKGIVQLISKSVKNLPEKNVAVIDSNFNYLSENINDGDDTSSAASMNDRYEVQRQFEKKIEDNITSTLEAVFGHGKVKTSVHADLDFDSKQTTTIKYDPASVVKSQTTSNEKSTTSPGQSAQVSGDANSYPISSSSGTSESSKDQTSTEYNVGQTEQKVVTAPGQVKKVSTSVVIDGTLSDAQKTSVNNIVMAATGYDNNRGDIISVEGMHFDDTVKKSVEADLQEMQKQQQTAERTKKYITYIGYPAAGVIGIILLIILISKLKSRNRKLETASNVDVVIDQPMPVNEIIKKQVLLDENDEGQDLTTEIKKYASKKPDQVMEIVKSWLAEDER